MRAVHSASGPSSKVRYTRFPSGASREAPGELEVTLVRHGRLMRLPPYVLRDFSSSPGRTMLPLLVERCVWDAEVGGSNPLTPTSTCRLCSRRCSSTTISCSRGLLKFSEFSCLLHVYGMSDANENTE